MQIRQLYIIIVLMTTASAAVAQQDTVINGATIEIIQSYKPEVQRAPRPEPTPQLPPVDTSAPRLRYTVPAQTLSFTYNSLPLRPLALDISEEETIYRNYVKLGGGNLSTIYLDAGIATLRGEDYRTNLHASHLSQSGAISDQKVSLTAVDATGSLNKKGIVFGGRLGFDQNTYHYYGYDHTVYNYSQAAVRQSFTDISFGIDAQDELAASRDFNWHPAVSGYFYSDKFDANETSLALHLPLAYKIDSNTALFIEANLATTSLKNNITSQSNSIVQLKPGIRFSRGIFKGHAAIAPTSGTGQFYILPDVEVNFMLPETQLILTAGFEANLLQNSYKKLSTQNPYIYNQFPLSQNRTAEGYLGIKSNIGKHITFNGRASWWSYNNLPVFVNDVATDSKQFFVLYDNNVNAVGLQAAIRYQVAETFAIGFSGQWMNFYKKSYEQLWHRPGVKFTGDISAQPIDKLTITAYISFIDELYALEQANRTFKLNSILDIGAGAEYEIIERLNVFIQANNLLNNQYQLWYQYDAFGLNVFGGVRFKF